MLLQVSSAHSHVSTVNKSFFVGNCSLQRHQGGRIFEINISNLPLHLLRQGIGGGLKINTQTGAYLGQSQSFYFLRGAFTPVIGKQLLQGVGLQLRIEKIQFLYCECTQIQLNHSFRALNPSLIQILMSNSPQIQAQAQRVHSPGLSEQGSPTDPLQAPVGAPYVTEKGSGGFGIPAQPSLSKTGHEVAKEQHLQAWAPESVSAKNIDYSREQKLNPGPKRDAIGGVQGKKDLLHQTPLQPGTPHDEDEKTDGGCSASIGLHPENASSSSKDTVDTQEQLIERAKALLKTHFEKDKDTRAAVLLGHEEFRHLTKEKKITKYLENLRNRNRTKSARAKTTKGSQLSKEDSLPDKALEMTPFSTFNNESPQSFEKSLQKEIMENTWYPVLRQCRQKEAFGDQFSCFKLEYEKHPFGCITFFEQFYQPLTAPLQHLFSILMMLAIEEEEASKERAGTLLAVACKYYRLERVPMVSLPMLQACIQHLTHTPVKGSLGGLLKLCYANELQDIVQLESEVGHLQKQNPEEWAKFTRFLHEDEAFNLDERTIVCLPQSVVFFTKAFLQLLKEDCGGLFVKNVPEQYRKSIINMCTYSGELSRETIENFIQDLSAVFKSHYALLNKTQFHLFLSELDQRLVQRAPLWKNKLVKVRELITKVVTGIVQKKIDNVQEILPCVDGDYWALESMLSRAAAVTQGDKQDFDALVLKFKEKNSGLPCVQSFSTTKFEEATQMHHEQIQQVFKRSFLQVQELCIRYVMANLGKHLYINFGMGNGKTLLCTAIAILLVHKCKSPVYIFTKGEYLAYRDHLKFNKLIKECGIPIAALHEPIQQGISFINERSLENIAKSKLDWLNKSYLIDDEYDKFLFGDGVKHLNKKLKLLSEPLQVIAFSGSDLSYSENRLLKEVLGVNEVRFPRINEIEASSVVHHQDLTVGSNLEQAVINQALDYCEQVPVIVVGSKGAMSAVEKLLSKSSEPKPVCYNLARMIGGKRPKLQDIHNIIEQEFNIKKANGLYGLFLIDERLSRGTDFPTSQEIEANRGVVVMITKIYGSRVEQQMIARVARLQNKGQWLRVIESGFQEVNYFKNQQRILDQTLNDELQKYLDRRLILKVGEELNEASAAESGSELGSEESEAEVRPQLVTSKASTQTRQQVKQQEKHESGVLQMETEPIIQGQEATAVNQQEKTPESTGEQSKQVESSLPKVTNVRSEKQNQAAVEVKQLLSKRTGREGPNANQVSKASSKKRNQKKGAKQESSIAESQDKPANGSL